MAGIAALEVITGSSSSIPSSAAKPLLVATIPGRKPKSRVGSACTTRTGSLATARAVGGAVVVGGAAPTAGAAGLAGAALGLGAAAGDAHATRSRPVASISLGPGQGRAGDRRASSL